MTIRFYLNREKTARRLDAEDNLTVLQYLRAQGLLGSKEGCASGDCGACTAVLVEVQAGELRYNAINTCIAFVSALHNKLLITVDGLADSPEALHPVQAAMVAAHGSQCGFCTPGFVMSLFALSKHPPKTVDKQQVADAIAGNLCRCTGYLPIIRAGIAVLQQGEATAADYYTQNAVEIAARLARLQEAPPAATDNTLCHVAADTRQLCALKRQQPQAQLSAGGSDLALEVTLQEKQPAGIIDISRIDEYRHCNESATHWTLGACVTIADCMEFFAARLPQLLPYLHRFGSPPIRARATVGGNIANASPIADIPPLLLALDASITLTNGTNTRTLPLQEFYLDYKKTQLAADEWLSSITIPRLPAGDLLKVYKISKRIEDDISIVAGAFYWQVDNDNIVRAVRLAYGGMAAIPARAAHCEARFLNQPWCMDTVEYAAAALEQDFTPLNDMRASSTYRLQVAAAILKRVFLESQAPLPRIEDTCHVG